MRNSAKIYVIHCLFLVTISCAPVFSDLQNASTLGKNGMEVGFQLSQGTLQNIADTVKHQYNWGLQLAYGITERIDARLKIESLNFNNEGNSFIGDEVIGLDATVISMGGKLSLIEDQLAFYLPIGLAFGPDTHKKHYWQLQPTAIYTLPVGEKFRFNGSVKTVIPLDRYTSLYPGFNLGIEAGQLDGFTFKAEWGSLLNSDFTRYASQFSTGVFITIMNKESNKSQEE